MAKAKGKKAKAEKTEKIEKHLLARRGCKLAGNLQIRTQKHGDDNVQASDLVVSEIELTEEEANTLLREPHACRALFAKGGRGKPDRPFLPQLDPLKLDEPIESARVTLYLGPNGGGALKFGVSRLKSVKLTRDVGPKILMSCMIQATPALDGRIGDLAGRLDCTAQIEIEYEHNAEQLEAFDGEGKAASKSENEKLESDVQAQIDAYQRGTPLGESAADTH